MRSSILLAGFIALSGIGRWPVRAHPPADASENIVDTQDTQADWRSDDFQRHRKQDGLCGQRTCDQFVTGRNLPYARALQIVQNEEYLSALDLDDIKIKRAYRAEEKRPNNRLVRRRGRRASNSRKDNGGGGTSQGNGGNGHMGSLIANSQRLRMGGMAAAAGGGAVAAAGAAFMALPGSALGVPGAGVGSGAVLPAVGQQVPGVVGAIPPGAAPIPPGVGPGGVPVGQPIPGITPGAGILPLGNSPMLAEALALLQPLGLTSGLVIPVAVFPPSPGQTLPAVSIIFLELSAAPVRRSLSLWVSKAKNLEMRARKFSAVRPNAFKALREQVEGKLEKLMMDLKCFLPRLKHNLMQHEMQNNSRLKQKLGVAPMIIQKRRSRLTKPAMKVTRMQMFAKNCFPEPLYGFRTKVTLESGPCVLGTTGCNATTAREGAKDDQNSLPFASEGLFFANDVVDEGNEDYTGKSDRRGRTFSSLFPPMRPYANGQASTFSRRQTGEEFASDGPPDCRVTAVSGGGCAEALTPFDLY